MTDGKGRNRQPRRVFLPSADGTIVPRMCRNIRPLNNFEPPATNSEVHDAALQYVRKIAGTSKPSKANEEAFQRAVHDIAHATEHLLADLVSAAPPKDRAEEAAKARARSAKRFASA
jgi:hypothetical protein